MALSANLFLRQSQSLVMTPQLMQSIQLLQMTHLELMQFIAQEVERNPLLEMAADDGDLGGELPDNADRHSASTQQDSQTTVDEFAAPPSLDSDWYENDASDRLNDRLDTNYDTAFADEGSAQRPDAPELLFLRLRGAVAAVESACERLAREAGGTRMDNAETGPDWAACRDQTLPFFNAPAPDLCLWRLSVPQTAAVISLPFAQLIEWHGAQRWLWAPASAAAEIRSAAAAVNGHATLFRAGVDGAPGVPRFDRQTAVIDTITQRLRAEFDPAGIFNPGRMG